MSQFSVMSVLGVCLLLSAAGCQGNHSSDEASAQAGAHAVPESFSVEYTRSGGMLGYADALAINARGEAAAIRGEQVESFQLNDVQMQKLYELLEELDFEEMRRPPEGPQRGGADYLSYTLTYDEEKIEKNDLNMPDQLQPVVRYLDEILSEHLEPLAPQAEE